MNIAAHRSDRSHTSPMRCVLVCAIFVAMIVGCAQQIPPATPQQFHRGWLWVFPGIEGGSWSVTDVKRAIIDAGVTSAISTYDWERPVGGLTNLMLYNGNREHAARLAQQIVDYRRTHPTQPIDLVGYSGGGGIAIMVAEALPKNVNVDRIILVQSAMSPDYDLCPALAHVNDRIVNVYCPSDWLFLGGGTLVFGTMDRKFTVSAGKVGFNVDRAVANPAIQSKLEQIPWTPEMMRTGHLGTHLSIMGYEWNRQYVAPLVLRHTPSLPKLAHTKSASASADRRATASAAKRSTPTTRRTTTSPASKTSTNTTRIVPANSKAASARTAANIAGAYDATAERSRTTKPRTATTVTPSPSSK